MANLTREELLVLLIEECGEVIQAATKCLRFGFNVDHGIDGYGNNKVALSREIGDFLGVVDELDVDMVNVRVARDSKLARAEAAKERYGVDVGTGKQP